MISKTWALAAVTTAALAATTPFAVGTAATRTYRASDGVHSTGHTYQLPAKRIEKITQLDGSVSSGVLAMEVNRPDITARGPHGVHLATGFVVQGDVDFQERGPHRAAMNADVPLRPGHVQQTIDAIESHHLVFQAEHQHLYNVHPMVWFVHFRGLGRPGKIAHEVHAVLKASGTPLPQSSPKHPTTSLPAKKLAKILGGEATVGEHGVVTVDVPRKHGVKLGSVRVSPDLNIATNIQFQPLGHGRAAALPDFAMTAKQVRPVTRIMRHRHWEVGCLYNQEINEHPQLFFSHDFKTGKPLALAHQIRKAINHTDA